MPVLEVRRHSVREKPNEHLSQAGVALARRVGEGMGPFDLVFSSPAARAVETAVAMGFAVDTLLRLRQSRTTKKADTEIAWDAPFEEYARVIRSGGATAKLGRKQARLWRSLAASFSPEGRGLLITHLGLIEAGAVAAFPDADHASWGPCFGCCEGVRLTLDGEQFVGLDILRVDAAQ
jgi:broad specificity phosphatase PhoE